MSSICAEVPNKTELPAAIPDVRFIGELPGCYVLASRGEAGEGVRVFACRVKSVSASSAVVNAPVVGAVGEQLTLRVEPLGLLRGSITRHLADGFAMKLDCTGSERQRLATRLVWLKKRVNHLVVDRREDKRLLPRKTKSVVLFPDDRTFVCFIIDMSLSGVAVSADIHPQVGEPIAVGTLTGHVARHLDGGFAVRFVQRQAPETLENALHIHPDARHTVLRALRQMVTSGDQMIAERAQGMSDKHRGVTAAADKSLGEISMTSSSDSSKIQ